MGTLASLLVSLKADFGDTDSAFGRIKSSLKEAGDEADHTKDKFHHLGEEGGSDFEHISENAADFAKELLELGKEALELTGIFEVLKESVEISAEIESTHVAMEAFTGSAEAATETMERLEEIAQSEALKFPEILPAAQHMMALGFSAEQTAEVMKVAGNASWALGTPLESITQRIAMMAMSGTINNRMLRSLGLSAKEVGEVLGVAGDDVSKAFKGMDESSRVDALKESLEKFGEMGKKQAETVSGSWIILKNSWHETFAVIGDDLQGATSFLERFGTTAAHIFADVFSNLPDVDALQNFIEAIEGGTSYEEASAKHRGIKPESTAIPENLETGPVGEASVKGAAAKAMAPERAKEAAAVTLAIIANKERENSELSALARLQAEGEISAEKSRMTELIELIRDSTERKRQMSELDIQTAQLTAQKIGAIDQAEHDHKIALIKSRIAPEIASKYTQGPTGEPDQQKMAEEANKIRAKAAGDIEKADSELTSKQTKNAEQVAKATQRSAEEVAKEWREAAEKAIVSWEHAYDSITKAGKQVQEEFGKETEKHIGGDLKTQDIKDKGSDQAALQKDTAAKLALERSYGLEVFNTLQNQISYTQKLADIEEHSLKLKQDSLIADAATADALGNEAEAAQLRNQADQIGYDIANKRYETETKIKELKQKDSLQTKIEDTLKQAPATLGGAIAGGITHTGKGGMDIGKEITTALRGMGKQLLGDVFQKAIEQMIAALVANTVINTLLQALGIVKVAQDTGLIAAMASLEVAIWAQIGLLGFAEGGDPPLGVPSIVGERGPELFVPHESGTVIPNHTLTKMSNSYLSSNTTAFSGDMHFHGVSNVRQMMREISEITKTATPKKSPYS